MNKPFDVAASVSARLANCAREQNYTFQEVLQYYAIERFLYRLAQSRYRDIIVLKGGVAFIAWRIPLRRATRDIDLHERGSDSVEHLETLIKEICELTVQPDGMSYDANSVDSSVIQDQADYQGIRMRFIGFLELPASLCKLTLAILMFWSLRRFRWIIRPYKICRYRVCTPIPWKP